MDSTNKDAAQWEACCSKTSSAFVKFLTQSLLAAAVMSFCMYQLTKEGTNKELYWGSICSILFTFMPHPQIGGNGLGKRDLRKELERHATAPAITPTEQQPLPFETPSLPQ
jgi:hypothetical protein